MVCIFRPHIINIRDTQNIIVLRLDSGVARWEKGGGFMHDKYKVNKAPVEIPTYGV